MLFTDPAGVAESEAELADVSSRINKLESRRLFLLNKLERAGVAPRDGARTMSEWTANKLDVTASSAARLVKAANTLPRHRPLLGQVTAGSMTVDRALATSQLAATAAPESVVDRSLRLDLGAVARLTHRFRRVRSRDEQEIFAGRHLVIQPSLDESRWRGWFELPAVDGKVVDEAISQRADEFRRMPGGESFDRKQRQADALAAMAADSLDRTGPGTAAGEGPSAAIFVDLDAANGSGGELGGEVEYGPRVGPEALHEVLCSGSVQLIGLLGGKPVITSGNAKAVPPAVRRFVAWRDGGCTVAGCHSRYRLQAHHIRHRLHQGDNDPDNLTTLCWFHHHVVIHGAGFRLHDDDPPECRRLVPPSVGRAPPAG